MSFVSRTRSGKSIRREEEPQGTEGAEGAEGGEMNLAIPHPRRKRVRLEAGPPSSSSSSSLALIPNPMGIDQDLLETLPHNLMDHQQLGISWMLERNRGILADDMGLGKTLQVLTCLHELHRRHLKRQASSSSSFRALILSPKTLMYLWIREHEQFKGAPKLRATTQLSQLRKAGAQQEPILLVTSYEAWRSMIERGRDPDLATTLFDVVILDEAHIIRNEKNRTSLSLNGLRGRRKYCITGTPINNSPDDLANLCRFLDLAPYDNPTWWAQHFENSGQLDLWKAAYFLRRDKTILRLPGVVEETIYVDFSPPERQVYETILSTLVERYDNYMGKGLGGRSNNTMTDLLVLTLRLRQWCNHPLLALPTSIICSSKTRQLRLHLEARLPPGGLAQAQVEAHLKGKARGFSKERWLGAHFPKTVIFSQWAEYLSLLEPLLRELGIPFLRLDGRITGVRRNEVVKRFQEQEANGECFPILLSTTKAGGMGLTLTAACEVILMDYWFNPFVDIQAINRVHRIGQIQGVRVYRFEISNSIETEIRKLQIKKEIEANKLYEGWKKQQGKEVVAEDGEGGEDFTKRSSCAFNTLSLLELGRIIKRQRDGFVSRRHWAVVS